VALHHDLVPGAAGHMLRVASARCAAVVATSGAIERAADPAARRLSRTTVIHPGVERARGALPAPPPGPPRALCLGALVPWKRADLAVEIAVRVPELALDVAGAPLPGDPPGFEAALRARAARPDLAGRVRFLGAVADPRPALAAAHCLLHCADREPFGLALVEALAAGRPVAAGAAAVRAVLADADAPAAAVERAAHFDAAVAARRFAAVVERVAGRA